MKLYYINCAAGEFAGAQADAKARAKLLDAEWELREVATDKEGLLLDLNALIEDAYQRGYNTALNETAVEPTPVDAPVRPTPKGAELLAKGKTTDVAVEIAGEADHAGLSRIIEAAIFRLRELQNPLDAVNLLD